MAKRPEPTYQEIRDQLDAVLARLERPDIQVDEAVTLYTQGLQLADALERHLEQAENTIQKLRLQADKGGG